MENNTENKKPQINKLVIVGGVVTALIFAGILGSAIGSNKSDTTVSSDYSAVEPAPAPVETLSVDDQYLAVLHGFNNYIIENNTDADLIAIGKQVCTTLDAGNTVEDLQWALIGGADGTETDSYWEFAGAIIGAGVAAYCPEYSGQIG